MIKYDKRGKQTFVIIPILDMQRGELEQKSQDQRHPQCVCVYEVWANDESNSMPEGLLLFCVPHDTVNVYEKGVSCIDMARLCFQYFDESFQSRRCF